MVGPAGFDLEFEQGELAVHSVELALDYVMCHRLASAWTARSHTNPALRVATDRGSNGAALLLRPALHQGDVGLVHFAGGKLLRQFSMRLVVLGDHHQSAGGAIEAMHDSRAEFAADSRECAKMMQQSIHQRATVAGVVSGSSAGVHHHAGGLVDDGQIVVFVDNVEWNFLRESAQRRRSEEHTSE